MVKYELQLKSLKIDVPNTGVGHDASHLYWAIRDNSIKNPMDKDAYSHAFHGGALKTIINSNGNPEVVIERIGTPKNPVGISEDFGKDEFNSVTTDDSTTVLKFESEEQMQTVVQLIEFAGGAINDLGEKYGVLFDNSNSVAFFIGKALGFNDAQLEGHSNKLDTGLVGKPGFNNDLSNGSNLDLDEVKENSKETLSEKQKEMFEELKSQIEHMSTEISYNNESNQDEVKVASEFGNTIGSIIRSNNEFSDLESLGLDISIDTLSHNIGELFTGDSYGFNDVLSDTGFEIAEGIGSYAISAYFTKNGSTAEFIGIDDNVAGGELINSYVNQYLSGITTDYLKDMLANRALDANYSLDGVDGLNIIAGMVGRYGAKDISGINSNTEAEAYGELPQNERSEVLQSQLLGFGVASEDTNILRSNVSSWGISLLLNNTLTTNNNFILSSTQLLGFGVASEDVSLWLRHTNSGVRCLSLNGTLTTNNNSINFNDKLDKLNANTSIKKVV